MGRYLVIWELDESKIPLNPEERKAIWQGAIAMTRQDIESGITKDWGVFLGQTNGYAISEATEEELHAAMLKYVPIVRFKVHQLVSIEQLENVVNSMWWTVKYILLNKRRFINTGGGADQAFAFSPYFGKMQKC